MGARSFHGPRKAGRWGLAASIVVLVLLVPAALLLWRGAGARPAHHEGVYYPQGQAALRRGEFDAAISAFRRSIEEAPDDPYPYRDLIDACARRGDLDSATPILRDLDAAHPNNACVHYAFGKVALKRNDLDAALREAQLAVALRPDLGYAHLLLGMVHYTAGRPEAAVPAWQRARRIFRRERDDESEALAVNDLAMVHLDLHKYRTALDEFEQGWHIQQRLQNPAGERLALANMGLTLSDMGEYEEAISTLGRALALARSLHDRNGEWKTMEYLGDARQKMGDYRRALVYADSVVALARLTGDRVGVVAGLLNRATAANDLGDPVQSLETGRRALALADSLGHLRYRSALLLTLGETYVRLGRLDAARSSFERCDTLSRAASVEANSAMAIAGLCRIALQEGDTLRAAELGDEALARCIRLGYTEGEGEVATLVSDLAWMRGDATKALAEANRAVELSREVGRRIDEARALGRRASIHLARGERDSAEVDAREGVRIATAIRSPEARAECEAALGDVQRATRPDEALDHYRAGIEAIEAIRGRLRLEEFKAGFLQGRLGVYFRAASLLVEEGRAAEALAICERSRARAFRDLMAASPAPLSPHVSASLAERTRACEERLGILEATIASVASAPEPNPARIAELEREAARARGEWENVRLELLLQDPSYGAIVEGGEPPSAEAIMRELGPKDALLEYFLGPRESICFVATARELRSVHLKVGASEAAQATNALRAPLLQPGSLGTLSFDTALAESLRTWLFDPARPFLRGATRLIIVPDGPLNVLPFEALVLSRGAGAGAIQTARLSGHHDEPMYAELAATSFLADSFAVSYLPAAGLLIPPSSSSSRGERRPVRSLLALGSSELKLGADEARAIARLFPGAICAVDAEATELRFKEEAPACRYLHVSSHGTIDEHVPLYSGLALAPDSSGRDDGFLHAYEVLSLPLSCDLVTLSACETGLGRLYAGEGLVGLTRSFLYAGARQALVSLWSVNDASTAMLMESFYAGLTRGLDPADALREAKSALRHAGAMNPAGRSISYAHPFFWAPFVLIGTGPRHAAPQAQLEQEPRSFLPESVRDPRLRGRKEGWTHGLHDAQPADSREPDPLAIAGARSQPADRREVSCVVG